LSIVGCGGGGAEQPPAPADTGSASPAAAPAAPGGGGVPVAQITDRSDLTTESFIPFKVEGVPAEVQQRLDTKQAMLLFFFNSAQLQTDDLRSQINIVIKQNQGNIDLLSYDLSKYTSFDASGNVEVDQAGLLQDKKAMEAVKFGRAVGVDQVPYIVIIDDQGYRIFTGRGFLDAKTLGREVQRAVR
jgi:hypothetical protein